MRLGCKQHAFPSPEYAPRAAAAAHPPNTGFTQALGLCTGAATLYSAVMLGYKLAHAEIIKFALDEKERLQQERTALLGELGASLSPELALQVERIIDRRSSFMPDNIITPRSNPADGKEADPPRTAREVHSTGPLSLEPSESSVSATCKCRALRAGACTDRRRCADGCFGRACCSAGAVRCGMLWHLLALLRFRHTADVHTCRHQSRVQCQTQRAGPWLST